RIPFPRARQTPSSRSPPARRSVRRCRPSSWPWTPASALTELGSESRRERRDDPIHHAIDLGIGEPPVGPLKHQAKRETHAAFRNPATFVAIEDLDGDEIRPCELADLLRERSSRLRAVDEHGQIAADRRLPGYLPKLEFSFLCGK